MEKRTFLPYSGPGLRGEYTPSLSNIFSNLNRYCFQWLLKEYYCCYLWQVRLWNRTKETAQKLAKELNEISNSEAFRAYENVQECAEDADVIVTATFTQEPLVKLEFLKRNAHINGKN